MASGLPSVLMVSEKPLIASTIAGILSNGTYSTRSGKCRACPVHEFDFTFQGENAHFRMTSVIGHIFSTDFLAEFQSWDKTKPEELFAAGTKKKEANPGANVSRHLKSEAKRSDYLVLWLDCDREGENICFEVMDCTLPYLRTHHKRHKRVLRAHFSSLASPDIKKAMESLILPNENEARAVDARQVLDLKVGVAFTRFQTHYFQGKYGNLDARLVSYGPCQTPTLGFCVARHDEIQTFEAEDYWTLSPAVVKNGVSIRLQWARGRVFDQGVCSLFLKRIEGTLSASLVSSKEKEGRRPRPPPLNTVGLLKVCSQKLGLGPHHTMLIAERLYTQGFISYPRTETTKYAANFDVPGTLRPHCRHHIWGDYVTSLFEVGINIPQGGHDAGDHPPITPTAVADKGQLEGDLWRVYDYITRHFIASLSPPCKYVTTKAQFMIGAEKFSYSGTRVTSPGFTVILSNHVTLDEEEQERENRQVPDMTSAGAWDVQAIDLKAGKTAAPDYLSEAELIGLMEKHGIGTDASIAVHINNICERGYVSLSGGRRLKPTTVGAALVHGYYRIDPDLVLPIVRSTIERYIDHIAQGKASYEEVVPHSLEVFHQKFLYFQRKIENMDALFEANFSTITQTEPKFRSKCGKCRRFMNFLDLKPARMFCPTCDEVYSLPQNANIKQYTGNVCPLDGFDLVRVTMGKKSKAYPVCPHCFNNPPFEDLKTGVACNSCPHPTCEFSMTRNRLCKCPDCEEGQVVFDQASRPHWRANCNACQFMVFLHENAHSIRLLETQCPDCSDVTLVEVEFHKEHMPTMLQGSGITAHSGCIFCDELLNSGLKTAKSKFRHPKFSRGRGRGRRRRGKR